MTLEVAESIQRRSSSITKNQNQIDQDGEKSKLKRLRR